ncbi:MAG: slipin family protein, partial [Flavobacteriales bacterium]|nr:slipin family protein [Flavobacteriales bacterium]
MLTVVEVADNQLVLMYRNGNFVEVLKPGRYTFFNSLVKRTFITMDLGEIEITKEIDRDLLMKPAL